MSTLPSDVHEQDLHPPNTVPALPPLGAPLSILDRQALRLGLWLLLRSSRKAERRADHDARSRLLAAHRHQDAHRDAVLRLHQLWPRP